MSIAIRSASSATAASANPPAVTVAVPAGVVDGDVMIAFAVALDNGDLSTPAGWTALATGTLSGHLAYGVWRRVAASEPADYTFTRPAGSPSTSAAAIVAYSGVSASAPVDVVSSVQASLTIPTVTTTHDNDWLVELLAFTTDVFAAGPGGTQRVADDDTGNDLHLYAYDEAVPSAGATGSRTFALTGSSGRRASVMVALTVGNVAPNAPTLVSPVGGAIIDLAVDNLLIASFSDPDAGDTPSAWEFRYRVVGAGSWTTTGEVASPSPQLLLAGGTLSAGDYEWQARSWDAIGTVGAFSSSSYFTAAATPAPPSITDPAHLSTIASTEHPLTISAPSLTEWEWRKVADDAGDPDPGTVYDSASVASSILRTASLPFPTNDRDEHLQARIKKSGLWSDWAAASAAGTSSVKVAVAFTLPPAPSCTVSPYLAYGAGDGIALQVDITNPASTGDEPTVVENRVWRRENIGVTDGLGVFDDDDLGARIAAGLALDASYVDGKIGSLRFYQYRVEAVGDNNTSTFGDWEGDAAPPVVFYGGGYGEES